MIVLISEDITDYTILAKPCSQIKGWSVCRFVLLPEQNKLTTYPGHWAACPGPSFCCALFHWKRCRKLRRSWLVRVLGSESWASAPWAVEQVKWKLLPSFLLCSAWDKSLGLPLHNTLTETPTASEGATGFCTVLMRWLQREAAEALGGVTYLNRITKHHCFLIKTQKPKASEILSGSADWGCSSSWLWLKRVLLNPLVLACLADLSFDGFYWLAGVFQAWLTALPHVFFMSSWKSHGKCVDSGLPCPDLEPQWPGAEVSVCLFSHTKPQHLIPAQQNSQAGRTTTQQGTVHDLIWDCSAPGRAWAMFGRDSTDQSMNGL